MTNQEKLARRFEKIILATCDKELNENIGFMLTKEEARIFALALAEFIEKCMSKKMGFERWMDIYDRRGVIAHNHAIKTFWQNVEEMK